MGLVAILSNKLTRHKSIIPDSIHGILGTIVIICILIQSFSGFIKLSLLENKFNSKRSMTWHGDFGYAILDFAFLALLFGIIEYEHTHVAIEIIVIIMMSMLWIAVYLPLCSRSNSSSNYNAIVSMSNDEEQHGIELGRSNNSLGDDVAKKPLLKSG